MVDTTPMRLGGQCGQQTMDLPGGACSWTDYQCNRIEAEEHGGVILSSS